MAATQAAMTTITSTPTIHIDRKDSPPARASNLAGQRRRRDDARQSTSGSSSACPAPAATHVSGDSAM
jgi:hypothetical protein